MTTTAEREAWRRATGVRPFDQLPIETAADHPAEFFGADNPFPSIRPVLFLTDGLAPDAVHQRVIDWLYEGRDVLTAEVGAGSNDDLASLARRTETVMALARRLAHRCAGKTVEVCAHGAAVPPAALMLALQRGFFNTFTAENPPPARAGWPTWEAMTK